MTPDQLERLRAIRDQLRIRPLPPSECFQPSNEPDAVVYRKQRDTVVDLVNAFDQMQTEAAEALQDLYHEVAGVDCDDEL